jgi:hypothetical protein
VDKCISGYLGYFDENKNPPHRQFQDHLQFQYLLICLMQFYQNIRTSYFANFFFHQKIAINKKQKEVLVEILLHFNPLNAELNLICHLLALVGAHPLFHVRRIRVN